MRSSSGSHPSEVPCRWQLDNTYTTSADDATSVHMMENKQGHQMLVMQIRSSHADLMSPSELASMPGEEYHDVFHHQEFGEPDTHIARICQKKGVVSMVWIKGDMTGETWTRKSPPLCVRWARRCFGGTNDWGWKPCVPPPPTPPRPHSWHGGVARLARGSWQQGSRHSVLKYTFISLNTGHVCYVSLTSTRRCEQESIKDCNLGPLFLSRRAPGFKEEPLRGDLLTLTRRGGTYNSSKEKILAGQFLGETVIQ